MQRAADTTACWQVGLARHDITAFESGRTGVGGWGVPKLRLRGIAEPIHARALVLRGGGPAIVMVAVELCFVSAALRSAILAELGRVAPDRGFVDEAVMICATHSHGGPDGTSPQLLYAATNGGISAWVFDGVVAGVVAAILEADDRAEPGRLRVAAVEVPASEPVAFNRSLAAFARNLDAPRSANRDPILATHRRSTCLRIEDLEGRALGLVNWFGVHGTSVEPGLERVHADNKGLAAAEVERAVIGSGEGRPEFVALFVQEAAGDVSPNPSADARRGLASARANAAIQARHALAGLRAAEAAPALACTSTARLRHLDMGHAPGPDQLVLGWRMVAGTDDGPGPLYPFRSLVDGLSRAVGAVRGEPKLPFLHLRGGVDQGRFFGVVPLRAALRLFAPIDPASAFVLAVDAAGLADRSLAPEVVPVQRLGLGAGPDSLTIVALPFEPTTMAGRRLRASVREARVGAGREPREARGAVVLATYANDYASYLTTPEEYAAQSYEGGATLFGPDALAVCRDAVVALVEDRELPGFVAPPSFDRDHAERQREAARERWPVSEAVPRRERAPGVAPLAPERDGCFHPATIAEVQALVRFARAEGRGLRVVGARHSIPAAIDGSAPSPSLVRLRLDRLMEVEFDAARQQVWVGAGCHLGFDPRDPSGRSTPDNGLCAQLDRRGWALASLGGVSHQTVAGFLATGSSGGSLRWSLSEQVLGLRLVDGRGQLRELDRERDPDELAAALVSLGLLGVVTHVRLQCEDRFEVRGSEQNFTREDAPFELDADGERGLHGLFAAHDYARVLWWPQPGVDRLTVWVADRDSEPGDAADYEAFPRVLGSRIPVQAAAGVALRTIARFGGIRATPERAGLRRGVRERALAPLYRAFVALEGPREFAGPWHERIPVDDQIGERWMPVEFTEIWLPIERAGEAMRRLSALVEADGYAGSQNFAVEIYPAKASAGWLSPAYARDSVRINLFWLATNRLDPTAGWFDRIHAALADLEPRVHWGKHLPRDPALLDAVASRYPERAGFLAMRERFDPDGVLWTDHWRRALGDTDTDATPPGPRELGSLRPTLFHVDDPANAGGAGPTRALEHRGVLPAAHAQACAWVLEPTAWSRWVDGLDAVERCSEAVFELVFGRARLRVRVVETGSDRLELELVACSRPLLRSARLSLRVTALGPTTTELRADLRWTSAAWTDAATRRRIAATWRASGGRLELALERDAWRRAQAELDDDHAWTRPPTPRVKIPPLFRFAPAGPELLHAAQAHLRAWAEIPAAAERVDRAFTRFEGAQTWLAHFLGVEWQTDQLDGPGAIFDEHFEFMTLRVRTVEHEPGRRWFAVCEGCSLPLATRMVEEIRFEPITAERSLVYWHVAFDAPTILRPGVGLVGPWFRAWMQRCVDQLAELHGR